jgi:hypothetical protein
VVVLPSSKTENSLLETPVVPTSIAQQAVLSEEKSLTTIVESVVKPVLVNRLAEQLLSRSSVSASHAFPLAVQETEPPPVVAPSVDATQVVTETASERQNAQTLVNAVVSTLVEALEADKSPESQEAVSKQFLVNYLGKLPTAESLLAQSNNQLLEASFEASLPGYPEMPALLFEGENEDPLPLVVAQVPSVTDDLKRVTTEIEAKQCDNDNDADEEDTEEDEDEKATLNSSSAENTFAVKVTTSASTLPKPKPKKNVPRSKRVKKNTGKGKK